MLQNLIKEAREKGGFYYCSSDSTLQGKGHQVLAQKGFKDNYRVKEHSPKTPRRSEANEGITYEKMYRKVKTGEKQQIGSKKILWLIKRPIYGDVYDKMPIQTKEILINGNSDSASRIIYEAARVEPDFAGRNGAIIVQGLITNSELIRKLMIELVSNPSQVNEVFKGVFPELDEKYHRNPNKKIVIGKSEKIEESQNLEGFVHNY